MKVNYLNEKCAVGNIYFPQTKWKYNRLLAFKEIDQWLKFHNRDSYPAILMDDFNTPLHKIKNYISIHFPNWNVASLIGNNFTYSKGSRI